MNYRKEFFVVAMIFVLQITHFSSLNLRQKNKRHEDSADQCYRQPLNFTVTKVNKGNFTCKGLISTWSCRGYCETYEVR
uniref:Uncharacterized protein n=1 Tax=Romanomermis culicivorax TaxID=13658 RepID=A0A915KR44_ROMCU